MTKWALYPGRFQPFHNGHQAHVDRLLELGKCVCVCVRDTPVGPKDPYTMAERCEMINAVFRTEVAHGRVMVMPIPDLEGVYYGRGVGFNVEHVPMPEDVEGISATKVRAGEQVALPSAVRDFLSRRGSTLFFTGLPCAGKTTLAEALKPHLMEFTHPVVHLDGDVLRTGLTKDLGFSNADRQENLRRVACMAQILNDNGITVLASFIAPMRAQREMIQAIVSKLRWIFVDTVPEVCEARDAKGMWAKARAGDIKDFTGVDAPYEAPAEHECYRVNGSADLGVNVNQIMTVWRTNTWDR